MEAPPRGVVLDTSAAIALLRGESAAPQVEQELRDAARPRMSTVNAAETVDVMMRVYGRTADEVAVGVDQLLSSVVEPIPASLELATRAGELRARYFRRDQRVSLADCFVLATAEPGDRIVTGDGTLAAVARDEGIGVVLLGA